MFKSIIICCIITLNQGRNIFLEQAVQINIRVDINHIKNVIYIIAVASLFDFIKAVQTTTPI